MFNYKILLFTVCLLCSYITNGQVLFNILHLQDVDSVNSTPWGYSIVDVENDTIKLNAIGASGSPGFIKSYLYNIYNDTSFQIINRLDGTSQRTSYYPIPGSFIRINDSIYVLGCTKISYTTTLAQDTICSGLIYFNKYGDTLFSKWYGMSEKFLLRGFQRIENNLFLLGVTKVIGDGTKAHIVRTSLGGDLIWEKTLTAFTTYYCNALSIASVSNNGYLVEGIMNSHDIGPIHISNVGLYRIDTNGNILWYKNIFNNANGGCYSVKEDGMGNFFLSGNIDTIVNLVDHNSNQFILKMDSNANINWIHIFNETPHILNNMWKFEIIGNGNLVFCGEQLETLGTTNHVGILGLMDSSGNVKWEHYYKQNDSSSYNYLSDVKQMPDGGFIATGICKDSVSQKYSIWLIRTDSNGCLVPGCVAPNSVEVFPEDKMKIELYPNPSFGEFVLAYSKAMPVATQIVISDIAGKSVYSQSVKQGAYKSFLSIACPQGIYLLQLINDKREVLFKSKLIVE